MNRNDDELEKTPIALYYHAIENKEINASKEINATYKHLYKKLFSNDDGFYFDEKKADKAIRFIQTFIHLPKTKGNPLCKLMLWQQAFISTIFGFVDSHGLRQYQEVCLIVARKNGKSALASMIALYMLIADGESEPEIYCCANKKEQAKLVWQMSADMIKKSKALQELIKVRTYDIKTSLNGGIYKALASDSNTLDGLNSSCIILDEIHNYKTHELYDVMIDSTSSRQQSLTLLTSTAGFVRNGFYDDKLEEYERIIKGYSDKSYIDNRRIAFIYKLDTAKEWTDERNWIKSNPALGVIRSKEKLQDDVTRTKQDKTKLKDLLTKFFDVPQTSVNHFFTLDEIANKEKIDITKLKPRYCIGGFDLSQVQDLTSTCIIFKMEQDGKLYCINHNWMPEEVYEQHLKTDKVPYNIWMEKGWLTLCAGNKIDYRLIYKWFVDIQEQYNCYMYKVGYDAWSAGYLVDDLVAYFGKNVLVPVRQGAKTLSLPLQNLKVDFQNKNIVYDDNQLLKWCLCNLMVTQDSNGNYNTIKNRNDKIRDDAAMALLDAYTVYQTELENYNNII